MSPLNVFLTVLTRKRLSRNIFRQQSYGTEWQRNTKGQIKQMLRKEHGSLTSRPKVMTDRRTDQATDQPTDQLTDGNNDK